MSRRADRLTASRTLTTAALLVALLGVRPGAATAQKQTGVKVAGVWSNAGVWTNGVPGPNDEAYIGCGYPSGAADIATVTLGGASTANLVAVGVLSGVGSGTLNLSNFTLSAFDLYLGSDGGGTATIQRNPTGKLSVSDYILVTGNSFSFAAGDVTRSLSLSTNSRGPTPATVTTAATGNVTYNVSVDPGNTLTLGAALNLKTNGFGTLDLRGTLAANGKAITGGEVDLGRYGGPYAITGGRGALTAYELHVSSAYTPGLTQFNLAAGDAVTGTFNLYGVDTTFPANQSVQGLNLYSNGNATPRYSTATTSNAGNVTGGALVDAGCTLTLGADLNLPGTLELHGTLNGTGNVTVAGQFLWYGGTLTGSGAVTINTAAFIISSSGTSTLAGRTLTANGNATWSGGNITLQNGAALVVAAGTTFTDNTAGAGAILNGGGAGSRLVVNGTYAPSGSGLAIPGGITLGGTGTVSGAVRVASGGTVAPGNGVTAGTLSAGGGVALNAGGTFSVVAGNAAASRLAITGALDLTGNGQRTLTVVNDGSFVYGQTYTYTIATMSSTANFAGATWNVVPGNFAYFAGTPVVTNPGGTSLVLQFTPVPEPAAALAACAVAAAGWAAFRKRRRAGTGD